MKGLPSRRRWRVEIIPLSVRAGAVAQLVPEHLSRDDLDVEILPGPTIVMDLPEPIDCCVVLVTTPVVGTKSGLEARVHAIFAAVEPTPYRRAHPCEVEFLAMNLAQRIRRLR